mgnify:CR=1 FL=1
MIPTGVEFISAHPMAGKETCGVRSADDSIFKKANIKIFGGTDIKTSSLYYPTSILDFPNCSNKTKKQHPTQKPVDLCEYLIKTFTNENDTVLDNCMGSGTTGVACKHLNRNFIGVELDPNYFEIAKNRIENEPTQLTLTEQKDVK